MTMMSNWSRSSRGGRVDVVMHCDDRISGLQRIQVVERCRLARECCSSDRYLRYTMCFLRKCVTFVKCKGFGNINCHVARLFLQADLMFKRPRI